MTARSLFARVSEIADLETFKQHKAGKPLHAAVTGLIGASRSLVAGALGRLRVSAKPSAVVLIVDGPESALDAIADLRAFVALEEKLHPQPQPSEAAPAKRVREKAIARLARKERWADPGLPAQVTVPGELRKGLFLESALFPVWDVLPTESDRPEVRDWA